MSTYINLNGTHLDAEEPVLTYNNRGFQYGDALYEMMHANGTAIQFFHNHLDRLMRNMKHMKMEIPLKFINYGIQHEMVKLLNKNKHLKGARIKLIVFRNGRDKQNSTFNGCSYLIESKKLETDVYILNEKGLMVDVFQNIKKPITPLSGIQTTNRIIEILAEQFRKEHKLNDCLLINNHNEIIQAIGSNLFLVKGDILKTPPLKSGCIDGILRSHIIEFASELGYKISHQHPVLFDDLMDADEMFLTDVINGIQWVSGIRQKRYFKTTAKKLLHVLKEKTRIE